MKSGDILEIEVNSGGIWFVKLDRIESGRLYRLESYCPEESMYFKGEGMFDFLNIKSIKLTDKVSVRPTAYLSDVGIGESFKFTCDYEFTRVQPESAICNCKYVYVRNNRLFGTNENLEVQLVK